MPSHSSIFTGLLPPGHGVRDNGSYALGEGAVTLAERLAEAGYTTSAFVSAVVLSRRYNLDQGFETYDDDLWSEEEPALFMIRDRPAWKTAERFLSWLGRRKNSSGPFFSWIHFFDPHQPHKPAAADLALAPTPYDAEIAGVDRQIGRIVDQLRSNGILEETILIVTSDHGESLGEHEEKTHGVFVYDATVRVPLIWRYPRLFRSRVHADPVRLVDLMPSILSAIRLPPVSRIDGVDLLTSLRGRAKAPSVPQYSESLLAEVGFGMAPLFAIRKDGYKFIRAPKPELYDLRRDPNELVNLVTSERRIAARLDRELSDTLASSRHRAVEADTQVLTSELQETLQALGYLAAPAEREAMGGIDPKDGMPLYNKMETARHLAQRQRWEEADQLLAEILAVTPRNVSALNIRGLIGVKRGSFEAAERHYSASLAVDPRQFRVYGALGNVALTSADFERAEALYRQALALNANFVEAMASMGFLESLRGNNERAEQWYRRGIAGDPTFPRVQRRLGDLYYERGDWAHALDYYQKTVQLLPSDFRAWVQSGGAARRLGRIAEAERFYRRAEELQPQSWVAIYNRACLEAVSGKPDAALETLRVAMKHGLRDRELLASDPDLNSLRHLAGYRDLLEQTAPRPGG